MEPRAAGGKKAAVVVELVGKDREVTRMQKAAKVQMITLTASENHAESPKPTFDQHLFRQHLFRPTLDQHLFSPTLDHTSRSLTGVREPSGLAILQQRMAR